MKLAPILRAARASGAIAWTAAELAVVETKMRARPEAAEDLFDREMRRWCLGLLRIAGVDLRRGGERPGPAHGPRLVIANHRSAYDIPILLTLFGGSVLSRADIAEWPLFGYAARRAQTIFVDRDSPQSGVKAIRAIREHLQRGRTVSVFPEGTTIAGDTLRPFSGGAFAAARGLDVEIVPVGLAYPSGCEYVEERFVDHIANLTGRGRIPVGVCVGAPRRSGGRTQVKDLEAEVSGLVAKARALL
ncbi:MAG: lysophospholipid acyltransferase family protein [Nannocystaceae bacterium]